jgi:hypothetical protein
MTKTRPAESSTPATYPLRGEYPRQRENALAFPKARSKELRQSTTGVPQVKHFMANSRGEPPRVARCQPFGWVSQ